MFVKCPYCQHQSISSLTEVYFYTSMQCHFQGMQWNEHKLIQQFQTIHPFCTSIYFRFPFVLPFWLTLPDPRKESSRKFFFLTYLGCIIWMLPMTYLLVWWSTIVGNTFGIPPEVNKEADKKSKQCAKMK